MNEAHITRELIADLQMAPAKKVIYLEEKTDAPIFFALLGINEPRDGMHQGVLVKALTNASGMGSTSVRERSDVAQRLGYPGIFGVIDGDGETFSQLVARFDVPHTGPLFAWKAYSIENLLIKAGWPSTWGPTPDWQRVLLDHAPYVALNRMHQTLKNSLKTLRLSNYNKPKLGTPLLTVSDIAQALHSDRDLILGYNVATEFQKEVTAFEQIVQSSSDEAHALVNGKWIVDVFAPNRTGIRADICRRDWINYVASNGGLDEARSLWKRITGSLP